MHGDDGFFAFLFGLLATEPCFISCLLAHMNILQLIRSECRSHGIFNFGIQPSSCTKRGGVGLGICKFGSAMPSSPTHQRRPSTPSGIPKVIKADLDQMSGIRQIAFDDSGLLWVV